MRDEYLTDNASFFLRSLAVVYFSLVRAFGIQSQYDDVWWYFKIYKEICRSEKKIKEKLCI